MRRILRLVPIGVFLCLACQVPPQPPFKPIAPVKMLMVSVIDPAAEAVWDSVGTIISTEGTEEIFPRTEEEWIAVQNSAVILAESGNLLMIEGRAMDRGVWMQSSQALIDAGAAAVQAAAARDPDAVFALGEQIYNACEGCHARYWIGDLQRGRVGP